MKSQTKLPNDSISAFTEQGSDAPALAAKFLKSLAHRDRLKVLCTLIEGERPVAAIEAQVGASQSAVSQHLARLKEEGIVTSRREGRQMLYSICDPTALGVIEVLYRRFCGAASS